MPTRKNLALEAFGANRRPSNRLPSAHGHRRFERLLQPSRCVAPTSTTPTWGRQSEYRHGRRLVDQRHPPRQQLVHANLLWSQVTKPRRPCGQIGTHRPPRARLPELCSEKERAATPAQRFRASRAWAHLLTTFASLPTTAPACGAGHVTFGQRFGFQPLL